MMDEQTKLRRKFARRSSDVRDRFGQEVLAEVVRSVIGERVSTVQDLPDLNKALEEKLGWKSLPEPEPITDEDIFELGRRQAQENMARATGTCMDFLVPVFESLDYRRLLLPHQLKLWEEGWCKAYAEKAG